MKKTGIIRKLDELGRIVIPKEIRKRFKIEIGDYIDISAEDNLVVLKKYNPLEEKVQVLEEFIMSVKEEHNCDVIVTNKDEVVVTTLDNLSTSESLSENLYKLMSNKEEIESLKNDNFQITNNFSTSKSLYIKKISSDDEFYGFIIILTNALISKSEKDLINVLKRYALKNIVK